MGSNSHGECAACCVEIGSFRNPLPGDGMTGIVLTGGHSKAKKSLGAALISCPVVPPKATSSDSNGSSSRRA